MKSLINFNTLKKGFETLFTVHSNICRLKALHFYEKKLIIFVLQKIQDYFCFKNLNIYNQLKIWTSFSFSSK